MRRVLSADSLQLSCDVAVLRKTAGLWLAASDGSSQRGEGSSYIGLNDRASLADDVLLHKKLVPPNSESLSTDLLHSKHVLRSFQCSIGTLNRRTIF